MATKILWFLLFFALFVSVFSATDFAANVTDNPADKLVVVLNKNRTAHKLAALKDNPGLACLALQYIKAYQGKCGEVGGPDGMKPPNSAFAETFAPNCGVVVSSLSPITGRLLGCQSKYVHAPEAFSDVLMLNDKSLEILYHKNHTEVGAAVTGTDGGSPYFWCVLFSNGSISNSFAFEGGVAKLTRPGCYSGANDQCSGADSQFSTTNHILLLALTSLVAMAYALGV
ncbi:uncharacterized protein LOC111012355 [Momordica charantia]|uniref:Uncharacterized protein LOC111012355 n=1 Tax=Momordica charantia TaxID=3673 RepID=A0A6J1CM03_MOMCH|nr:uncharacterized protein LOC111012355 [Momordica charantia]